MQKGVEKAEGEGKDIPIDVTKGKGEKKRRGIGKERKRRE